MPHLSSIYYHIIQCGSLRSAASRVESSRVALEQVIQLFQWPGAETCVGDPVKLVLVESDSLCASLPRPVLSPA